MRILSVELFSSDPGGSARFYSETLGLPVLMAEKDIVEIGAGNSRLIFRQSATHQPIYHVAFNIPFALVEEAAAIMERRVPIIRHENRKVVDFSAWNAKAFYFADNNGNIVELIGRADLLEQNLRQFDAQAIYCISEAGIVASDLKMLSEKIKSQTGVDLYEKQPFSENFAAMGNAEGLLILSAENRQWFPTEIPAMKFPIRIIVANGEKVVPLEFNF